MRLRIEIELIERMVGKLAVVSCFLLVSGYGAWAQTAISLPVYQKMPAKECIVRDGLGNVMSKIRAGGEVRVAYLGGSITEMDGWRRLSREWLQEQYPSCSFKEIFASIGGTGSSLGVYRFEEHVLKYDPDLIFVEFATNDRGENIETIWRNFEGIVRKAWKKNPQIDIVFTYTVIDEMVPDYQAGKCPVAASAMEILADHFGIPSICFGPRVVADVTAGELVMNHGNASTAVPTEDLASDETLADWYKTEQGKKLFSKDGVHPILRAHRCYYLASIVSSWPALTTPAAVNHGGKIAKPFFDTVMEDAKLFYLDEGFVLGTWSRKEQFAQQFGVKSWFTQTPGDKVRFSFAGSRCGLLCAFGRRSGQLLVTVDGARQSAALPLYDQYGSYLRAATLNVYSGETGHHDIELELDKNQPKRSVATGVSDGDPNYDGTEWYLAGILLLGDLEMKAVVDPANGSVEHVNGPHVEGCLSSREVKKTGGGVVRLATACQFAPGRQTADGYNGWKFSCCLTFDRAVAEGTVSVYDAEGESDWRKIEMTGDWEPGVTRRLPVDFGTFADFSNLTRLSLGVENLMSDNVGTRVTMEARLHEVDGSAETGRYMVLSKVDQEIAEACATSWFDARIGEYALWPEDAPKADYGVWSAAGAKLGDVADVAETGVLMVDAMVPLTFRADLDRRPGDSLQSVTVESRLALGTYGADALPETEPEWKGALIVVKSGNARNYYGLVNGEWVKMDGPVPSGSEDGQVMVKLTFTAGNDETLFVTYEINGEVCRVNGATALPVSASASVSAVGSAFYLGEGSVTDLTGSAENRRRGVIVIFR